MKKSLLLITACTFLGCAEMQRIVDQLPQTGSILSNADIANGLKEALNQGIDKQVTKLTQTDGFYKNEAVKILLPEELKK